MASTLIIGANGDAIFRRLMLAIDRADLADDPQLASNAGRDARAVEIYGVIDAWVAANDEEAILRIAAQAQVPASRIFSVADMCCDPQFLARQMLEKAQLPDGKEFLIPGIVPKLTLTPGETKSLGPNLGEHTELVARSSRILPGRSSSVAKRMALSNCL
jgi:formyl-CoA transferase